MQPFRETTWIMFPLVFVELAIKATKLILLVSAGINLIAILSSQTKFKDQVV